MLQWSDGLLVEKGKIKIQRKNICSEGAGLLHLAGSIVEKRAI